VPGDGLRTLTSMLIARNSDKTVLSGNGEGILRETNGVASYVSGARSARFEIPQSRLEEAAGRSLQPWLEAWHADDPAAAVVGGSWVVTLPYSIWGEAGTPPSAGTDPEIADLFSAQHSAISRLVASSQRILIETVGHVGAPDVSFLFSVDGHRLEHTAEPTPFPLDGSGHRHALVPSAFVAYERVCHWNTRAPTSRAEQIYFISDLRDHLDRAVSMLADAKVPFSFELDPHLRQFRAHRPASMALAWKPHKNGQVFDLEVEQIGVDGIRSPINLDQLDAESPIVALSATEHLLLDNDMAAVARAAKPNRNKLRKHVESHFSSPATLVPEGIALDKIDLSAYGPRVKGFAPIIKADRYIDIRSSGTAWYEEHGGGGAPFLRLEIAQSGGIETLELKTPEEAAEAVVRLESALAKPTPEVVSIGERRIQPTQALVDRLKQDLSAFRARGGAPEEGHAMPAAAEATPGRLAAVISEDAVRSSSSPMASASAVPWAKLDELLAPSRALKPHQRAGVAWLWAQLAQGQPGVLLADDMGLGKTLQLAAFLAMQRTVDMPRPHLPNLIVCPVILLANWQSELAEFFRPHVFTSLLVLHGETLRRIKHGKTLDLTSVRGADYVLTNYETLEAYQQSLLTIDWNVVILDEAQRIKNSDTYCARAARGLKRRFGICSTGTPVENRLSDLWGLYDFLSPGEPFSTIREFKTEYETDVEAGVAGVRVALRYPGTGSSLLRRTKSEVLDLPPKTPVLHAIPMTPRQVEHERSITRAGPIFKILQGLQKLYQHPRLLLPDGERSIGLTVQQAIDESPKLALCIQILEDIQRAGEKALVFTLWTAMQDLLVDVIKAKLGVARVRVINGDPAQRRRALDYIKEFSATDGFDVLVLSPLAAGTGLTITAANHVIHYGRWWNPAREDQATDRAYRIGQTRPVHVHYPLLHHPGKPDVGFDMKLHALVEGKRGMARDFLAPQAEDAVTLADIARLDKALNA
jgi:SNF2 domain-containing protein/helicase-like protein